MGQLEWGDQNCLDCERNMPVANSFKRDFFGKCPDYFLQNVQNVNRQKAVPKALKFKNLIEQLLDFPDCGPELGK